jgi:hypothetical protein
MLTYGWRRLITFPTKCFQMGRQAMMLGYDAYALPHLYTKGAYTKYGTYARSTCNQSGAHARLHVASIWGAANGLRIVQSHISLLSILILKNACRRATYSVLQISVSFKDSWSLPKILNGSTTINDCISNHSVNSTKYVKSSKILLNH